MHTVVHMLSKPSLFPSISLFFHSLCCFSPSCTLLPALSTLPFISDEASELHRQREQRRRKEGAATRGNEKREEMRRNVETESRPPYLRWHTHTHIRRHTGAIVWWFCCGALWSHRLSLMNVWPLFLPLSSFHLLPTCLLMEEWLQGESKILLGLFWGSYHDGLRCQGSE